MGSAPGEALGDTPVKRRATASAPRAADGTGKQVVRLTAIRQLAVHDASGAERS
jgi:hypothetical protein